MGEGLEDGGVGAGDSAAGGGGLLPTPKGEQHPQRPFQRRHRRGLQIVVPHAPAYPSPAGLLQRGAGLALRGVDVRKARRGRVLQDEGDEGRLFLLGPGGSGGCSGRRGRERRQERGVREEQEAEGLVEGGAGEAAGEGQVDLYMEG